MAKREYNNSTLARRVQTYPDLDHFKMFKGNCYVLNVGDSIHMNEILKFYYSKLSASEREHFIRKYDEYIISDLLINWQKLRSSDKLSREHIAFLYEKIKYRKVMLLNIGFNKKDFDWANMVKVFDVIFTSTTLDALKPLIKKMRPQLQDNINAFCSDVGKVKSGWRGEC
jgi:hypothetical protein